MVKESILKEPGKMPEIRLGKISSKRQLTIPKDFYDKLNLTDDVEIILEEDGLKIRSFRRDNQNSDDYSDLVLKSILDEQGFTTPEALLEEFKLRMNLLPLAAQDLIDDVRKQAARDKRTSDEIDKELFGED